MGQVAVSVNGQSYQITCDDGQEDHLRSLGELVDARVGELIASIGQVGDMRLLVMTSLLLADEANESKGSLASLRQSEESAGDRAQRDEIQLADNIDSLAQRIEAIAEALDKS